MWQSLAAWSQVGLMILKDDGLEYQQIHPRYQQDIGTQEGFLQQISGSLEDILLYRKLLIITRIFINM